MANMVARPQSLQDYLHDQLGWFDLEPELRAMADRIIYNLDTNGYLQGRLEDLLGPRRRRGGAGAGPAGRWRWCRSSTRPASAPATCASACCCSWCPACRYYEQLRTLIANHLEDLEHNRLPVISRETGYSIELIQKVLGELRKLNPKPGRRLQQRRRAAGHARRVRRAGRERPVSRAAGGRATRPACSSAPTTASCFRDADTSEETREYIKRKINSAQWLIDSIQQRRSTLTKVARAIVDHQKEFLDKGPEAIEPLKMQQIADKVGVHVTTVSRAVDEKWIQTPRGIFPLKRFFCGGTTSAAGEEVAWDAVRLKLQEIVDGEDKQHPLSDDQLVQQLAAHGITVARRTVTKYRKAMGILSSRQRRDWGEEKK